MSRAYKRQRMRNERRESRNVSRQYLPEDDRPRIINERKLFNPSKVQPKTENQRAYMESIDRNDITFGLGPAGSGKTYLAVAKGVEAFQNEEVQRLVFIRPCLGVGRTSGFLPGDLEAKVSHYLRPILDELRSFYTPEQIRKLIDAESFELTSLEYARGRSLKHSFVILDEAQNATRDECWTFLTRLGEGSKYVITGDISRKGDGTLAQSDLHPQDQGALEAFADRFGDIPGIATVTMNQVDIVRHPLVRAIVERGQ